MFGAVAAILTQGGEPVGEQSPSPSIWVLVDVTKLLNSPIPDSTSLLVVCETMCPCFESLPGLGFSSLPLRAPNQCARAHRESLCQVALDIPYLPAG